MPSVPTLKLSHGQVLWCLAGGREATPPVPDQVRYLRQRGIPFADGATGQGRGVRLAYGFNEFIELGIALEALRLRLPPRHVDELMADRMRYRNLYAAAYAELAKAPAQLDAPPSGARVIFEEEYFIRLHDRFSESPGKITVSTTSATRSGTLAWVEQYDGEDDRDVIPLKAHMIEWLRLARVAPETRPGPKY